MHWCDWPQNGVEAVTSGTGIDLGAGYVLTNAHLFEYPEFLFNRPNIVPRILGLNGAGRLREVLCRRYTLEIVQFSPALVNEVLR